MILVLALVIIMATAGGTTDPPKCDPCDNVDCASYSFTVNPHDNGYAECRFKIRRDNPDLSNKFKSGIQVHGYSDVSLPEASQQKDTQDCPAGGKLRFTENPRYADGMGLYPGGYDYISCCVPKVLDFCYYKVVAYFDCGKWSPMPDEPINNDRRDDDVKTMEVWYRNKPLQKTVTVIFYPKLGKVTCVNNFGGSQELLYKGNGKISKKDCGDSDINVKIERYTTTYKNGYEYIMLKTIRYECGQYAAMHTDPSDRVKFTMRTVVDPTKNTKSVGGTLIAPVLAQTFSGVCGKIVKSVTYNP